ncbi:MAG TPA: hypothetical protein VJ570_12490 [Holophagaceae bacterium]|nr:hypothetical protein [Holophagaceae bacterium]
MIAAHTPILVFAFSALAVVGCQVYAFRFHRVRRWREYAWHFPDSDSRMVQLRSGPSHGTVGEIALHHIWHYLLVQQWSFFLPMRASWLHAELTADGVRLWNDGSLFQAVNDLPRLFLPRERILWATADTGANLFPASLRLDVRGEFEPGKDPAFSLPLQLSIHLFLPSDLVARAWSEHLGTMGVSVLGMEGLAS